jgi:hypothetical protein
MMPPSYSLISGRKVAVIKSTDLIDDLGLPFDPTSPSRRLFARLGYASDSKNEVVKHRA